MKRVLAVFLLLFTVALRAADGFLSLSDATGGAPTGFFMRAAVDLSMTAKMNFSMSRKLPSEALAMLDKDEVDAVLIDHRFAGKRPNIPIAADALALYVSTANPAVDLTKKQVLEILTARRPNWKNYIRIDFDIQRIAPELLSESGTIIRRIYGEIEVDREIFKVDAPTAGFAFINTASIFFTRYLPQFPPEVRPLKIDGIAPTSASISDGTYPLSVRYVLVYKELTPKLQALIYLLKLNQYRSLITAAGLQVLLEE